MQIALNKVNKHMSVCYAKLVLYDCLLNIVLTVYFNTFYISVCYFLSGYLKS